MQQKLILQKLRASLIFEDQVNTDMLNPVIKDFSTNIENFCTDEFFLNNVINKMPNSAILSVCELILNDFDTFSENEPQILDSGVIVKGILSLIMTKISKLIKQKRKLDETVFKKPVFNKILSGLPTDLFLCENIGTFLGASVEILVSQSEPQSLDIKTNDLKILSCLTILGDVPVIFCDKNVQKLLIVLLLGLVRDMKDSNCATVLKSTCENIVFGIIQHSKFDLLDLLKGEALLRLLQDFERFEQIFFLFANIILKDNKSIVDFQTGITHILTNIKDKSYLKCGLIVVNLINKNKKIKLKPESKQLLSDNKSKICDRLVKMLSKKSPENDLIEAYAISLKTFLAKDENSNLDKLRLTLRQYLEFCLNNLCDENMKGSLLLLTTTLHHKNLLNEVDDNFPLKVWDSLKSKSVSNEALEDYSHLVILITSLIPNEQFDHIFGDLLKATVIIIISLKL